MTHINVEATDFEEYSNDTHTLDQNHIAIVDRTLYELKCMNTCAIVWLIMVNCIIFFKFFIFILTIGCSCLVYLLTAGVKIFCHDLGVSIWCNVFVHNVTLWLKTFFICMCNIELVAVLNWRRQRKCTRWNGMKSILHFKILNS